MPTDSHTKSKKAYLVSLKHKLKKHLQQQTKSLYPVDRRWLNGFMAAGFHSGLISLTELKLEYMKAHRNAYDKRMTEAQEQQLHIEGNFITNTPSPSIFRCRSILFAQGT